MKALLTWGAFRATLLHLLLSLCLQGQNFWWTLTAAAAPAPTATVLARQVGILLLSQWSSVLASLLVGVIVAALLRRGGVRSGLLVSVAAGILLVVDAWAFRVLGDHIGAGLFHVIETPSFLTSSLLAEIDVLVPVDLLLLALGIAWQARGQPCTTSEGRSTFVPVSVILAYLVLSAVALVFTFPPELSWHPIVNFFRQSATVRTPYHSADSLATGRPVSDPLPIDPEEAGRLAVAAAAVASLSQPNIVLLVLESTGARQLLHDGEIDPKVTPNLARLARNGVLFDHVYTNAPSTAQANLAMVTGGRYPTWESVVDLMRYNYTGDVLARSFKKKGYRTALFASSDLGYLETRRFFAQAGYDVLSDFGLLSPSRQDELRLNSWGGRDDATALSAAAWLDQGGGKAQPFFLHLMTNSPHHPYQIPPDSPRPVVGGDIRSRYLNALHHADLALGILWRKIEAAGQAERTVFVVTGDHGEAFNRLDWRSFGHRQGLYEAAVNSFLLVSSPKIGGAIRSSRIGNHDDMLSTLLALAGGNLPMVPGQNLLGEGFQQRMAFFQFGDASGSWGLRDGRWKYISPSAVAPPELYDLATDPDERLNLADNERERVRLYDQWCSNWFFGRNEEFVKLLSGYAVLPARGKMREENLGLELLTAGVLIPDGNRTFFVAAQSANPVDRIALETTWRPLPQARRVTYHWQSPAGRQIDSSHELRPLVKQQRAFLPGTAPWPVGVWTVTVDVDGRRVGLAKFEVTLAVPERAAADFRWPELISLRIGLDSAGHALPVREIPAGEPIRFESEWNLSDHDREMRYVLIHPSGAGDFVPFTVLADEGRHAFNLTPPQNVERGQWSLAVIYKEREIARSGFRIGAPSAAPSAAP